MSAELPISNHPLPAKEAKSSRKALNYASALTLVAGDVLVLTCALAAAVGLRLWTNRWIPIEISWDMFLAVLAATMLLPLGYGAARLYPGYGQTAVERLRKRSTVTAFGFGAMILFDYLAQNGQWSRGILLAAAALSLIAIPAWDELAIKFLISRKVWGEGVVVIGPRERRRAIIATLDSNRELGWVAEAEADLDSAIPTPRPTAKVALLALPMDRMGMWLGTDDLPYRQIILVPDVDGIQTQWITACSLGPYLGLQVQQNLLVRHNQFLKRGMDVVAGVLLLLLTSPIIAISAAAIWLISPGPVFFAQTRTGRGGVPFRMWKLRTMVPDAEARLATVIATSAETNAAWQKSMKLQDDPRILPWVGKPLRRFSMDELPQLWNVALGEMSLIGPRPLPSYHTDRLAPLAIRLRERVRPGITGLWQVSGRSDASTEELQNLDIYYVRNWSFWLDIHILARTLAVVLSGKGAC